MDKIIKGKTGYVAMNKGEFDLENISFFNTKKEAISQYGGRQDILKVEINFIEEDSE